MLLHVIKKFTKTSILFVLLLFCFLKTAQSDVIYVETNAKGSGENFQITFAKEGKFKQIGNSQFLELNFGETISVINNKITNFKFKKTDFNLSNFDDNATKYKKTQEVATLDLIKCYHNLKNFNFIKIDQDFEVENCRSDNIDNIIKELYKRIIIPLYLSLIHI